MAFWSDPYFLNLQPYTIYCGFHHRNRTYERHRLCIQGLCHQLCRHRQPLLKLEFRNTTGTTSATSAANTTNTTYATSATNTTYAYSAVTHRNANASFFYWFQYRQPL